MVAKYLKNYQNTLVQRHTLQSSGDNLQRRVGDSINILTMNECVYSISENMQELEGMSGKIKVLHKGIDGLCRKIRSEIEETEELQRLIEERNRLMGACQRIGYVQQVCFGLTLSNLWIPVDFIS